MRYCKFCHKHIDDVLEPNRIICEMCSVIGFDDTQDSKRAATVEDIAKAIRYLTELVITHI